MTNSATDRQFHEAPPQTVVEELIENDGSTKFTNIDGYFSFKIVRGGQPDGPPYVGKRLLKKLDTHRWYLHRTSFEDANSTETYESVISGKSITSTHIKKLLNKASCAREIAWPNGHRGILLEVGGTGYYLVTPVEAV